MTVADQRVSQPGPVVSVLIPAYNVADYLDKSVASALAQDVEVEVVIVDDCSTDAGATAWVSGPSNVSMHAIRVVARDGSTSTSSPGRRMPLATWPA